MAASELDPVWKALADPTRRHILDLLKERARTTGELSAAFSLSRFAVMKHLGVLERAGLVVVRRNGRERWNHLNAVPLRRIYEHYIDPVSDHLATSLLALSRTVEGKEPNAMSPTAEAPTRSMSIEQEVTVSAPAARVFHALTHELDKWWSARHYDEPTKVTLEPRIGGRFYEEHGSNAVLWATVTCLEPGRRLVLDGPIGLTTPASGLVTFDLEEHDGKTTVRVSHRVVGEITEEQVAGYGRGWENLMQRDLPAWIERAQERGPSCEAG
jgi:DNA-binding transcriptional ArsR family regulator/uncharacterized protein YndB with AHSA1/START domain